MGDEDLSDALICDSLRISWDELRRTPERVISYRLAIKAEIARIRDAQRPIRGDDGH